MGVKYGPPVDRQWLLQSSPVAERHLLKHLINHANMEVHMLVQAGAEPVDEGHGTNVQRCLVQPRRGCEPAGFSQSAQENAQHHIECRPVALYEVTQPLWYGEHPMAHRKAIEDVIGEVCSRLHHAPGVARGADTELLQE